MDPLGGWDCHTRGLPLLQLHFSIGKDLGSLLWPKSLTRCSVCCRVAHRSGVGDRHGELAQTHQTAVDIRLRTEAKMEQRLLEQVTPGHLVL